MLVVAAYTSEIDGVVLLDFPQHLVTKHNLSIGDRLLACSLFACPRLDRLWPIDLIRTSLVTFLTNTRGLQKRPAERGHVKKKGSKCQKYFRHVSTVFAQGRKSQKVSKLFFDFL